MSPSTLLIQDMLARDDAMADELEAAEEVREKAARSQRATLALLRAKLARVLEARRKKTSRS